jgi:hypothetical protein
MHTETNKIKQTNKQIKTHKTWVASQEALVFVRVTSLTLPLFNGNR